MHAPNVSLADNLRMPPLAQPVAAVDATALARSTVADPNSPELSFIVGRVSWGCGSASDMKSGEASFYYSRSA